MHRCERARFEMEEARTEGIAAGLGAMAFWGEGGAAAVLGLGLSLRMIFS